MTRENHGDLGTYDLTTGLLYVLPTYDEVLTESSLILLSKARAAETLRNPCDVKMKAAPLNTDMLSRKALCRIREAAVARSKHEEIGLRR